MYIKLNAAGRVCAAALNGILPDGMEITIPEGFELDKHGDWRLEGGALVCDPLPELEPPPSPMEQLQAEVADLTLALAELIGTGGAG